jgi:hypothetical protein
MIKPYSLKKKPAARRKSQLPFLFERHVQETVSAFLILKGWRAFRMEMTVQRERRRAVGEIGMPDYLYIRYAYVPPAKLSENEYFLRSSADVMWIEFKRSKSHKPTKDQAAWHAAEHDRGALVKVVDNIDEFIAWYNTSDFNV